LFLPYSFYLLQLKYRGIFIYETNLRILALLFLLSHYCTGVTGGVAQAVRAPAEKA
jgi:hypothetical protein